MRASRLFWVLVAMSGVLAPVVWGAGPEVKIVSKGFTEGVILAALATQLAQDSGAQAVHRQQLGGTQVLWNALLQGEIDTHPEYTGTISEEILVGSKATSEEAIRSALAERGVRMSRPLGFNNTYAIGMKAEIEHFSAPGRGTSMSRRAGEMASPRARSQ